MQHSPQPITVQPQATGASGSFAELLMFTEKQLERDDKTRQEARAERAEQKQEMEHVRQEMEAKMEAKLEKARQEMQSKVEQVEEKLTPAAAITGEQIASLGARLEALHGAELLSDEELFTLEDTVADYVELQSSMGVVTLEAAHAIRAADKLVKLVALSEHIAADGAFSRQARRKYL